MNGSPDARRQHIMEWLSEAKSLPIETLVTRLSVSAMTVHRDLDMLAKDGLVQKSYGYVMLVERAVEPAQAASLCAMCRSEVPFRTVWTIQLQDGTLCQACCAHCGFLIASRSPNITLMLTRDFIYGRMVNALEAVYVLGSRVRLCCSPSLLAFCTREDAEDFVKGFGGAALTYGDAQAMLSHQHHPVNHSQHG